MSKIAFLYPGQGAQVAGMGKDFYEQSPLAKEVFDKSCEIFRTGYETYLFRGK